MHCSPRSNKRLFLAVLAVLLVVVPFTAAVPLTTLDIAVKVPEYSRQPTLTLEGTTKANIDVHMFVNTVRMRVVKSSSQGVFRLVNVPLTAATNAVRLEAHEGTAIAGKDFTVVYDGTPPVVVLDKEIPAATTANSLTVSGDVNEKVTINYRVTHKADLVAPDIVTGLRASKVEKNAVELAWNAMNITDFKEFLVSRDGRPVASVTLPGFRDEGLPTGRSFSYSVAAVDASCNIGNTAELSATTLSGGQNRTLSNATAQLGCVVPFQNATAGSPFSLTFSLASGANIIEIIFRDAAGNEEIIQQTVLMDNAGPKFLDTNLEEISPSYIPDITIKGKLDERATVFVYINDEKTPETYVLAESDGSFSAKVKLRASVRLKPGTKKAGIEVGEGWANKIRLEAVDLAGNKAALGPVDVDFLLCGSGTWWRANIGEVLPSMLLPRLMIQGVQQIGIPFNISYIGSNTAKLGKVDVRPIALAAGAKKDFDHDWVRANAFTRAKGAKDLVGYVQVEFLNVDPLPDKPTAGPNEKELALSDHRKGECLVPGAGCVKLFLQMDISFQEIIQLKPTDPKLPIASPQIEKRTQKVCLPIEVGIDRTIPNDVIPKGLLRTAVKVIEKAITYIDKVLKPLTTVGEYVLYGCLASNVWLYYNFFTEKMACEGSSIMSAFTGGSGWNKAVAEAGLCDEAYGSKQGGSSGDVQKQQKCKSCEQKIESRKKFEENIMHGLCDRIGCPSAPTFTYYIKSKIDDVQNLGDVSALVQKNDNTFFKKWSLGGDAAGTGGKLFAGNDCAFTFSGRAGTGAGDYITPTYAGGRGVFTTQPAAQPQIITSLNQVPVNPPQPVTTTYGKLGIRELYDIAKGKTPSTLKSGPTAQDCKQLMRPAHPNCCGVQYQRDWSSACGLGTAIGASLDTFDELKQSTCLSAQQANADAKDLGCNSLWNSVAGFCEKNTGQPSAQVVNPGLRWSAKKLDADGNEVYIFIIPASFDAGRLSGFNPSVAPLGGGGTATQYRIYRGYAVKTPKFESLPPAEQTARAGAGKFRLSDSMTAALEKDLTPHFGQVPTTAAQQKAPPKSSDSRRIAFGQAMCAGANEEGRACDENRMRTQVYDEVDAIVGVPEQQYIVRPYSGLLRSVECACLPAVTSYLQMWRSVLGAFHGCFSKILLTGEGSEGFCAAKLSGTICDLFFEAISCFTQKFNSPGVGARAGTGGFGDVLGALTGAGTDVSRSVGQRYGDTPLYKSLFSDRKLVHAICTWAFTGTWDLNVQGLFQQQVEEIPVDTSGALTTCQRTFISYDPTTTPAGMTTWAYRVAGGLIAGADVRYRLKLKCSSGFSCDPTDYADGKCDCSAKEEVLSVSDPALGNGLAKKFDLVNFDAPFVVSPQTAHDSAGYRYDTAILEWEWTDPQTKSVRTDKADCRIRETEGGRAPAFCALDAFSGKFRCMFGEQEAGIRITGTTALYPEKQQVFALGQPLGFAVDLRQKFPEERRLQQQSKKFLTYDIRDGTGTTVRGPNNVALKVEINDILKDTYALETNGAYRKLVPDGKDGTPLGNFVLDEATIKAHAKSGPASTAILQDIWGASVTQKFVKNIRVEDSLGVPSGATAWFSIYFPTYGADAQGEETFTVHRITAPGNIETMPPKGAQGWAQYRSAALPANLDRQSVQRPQNSVRVTLPPPIPTASGQIVSIDFDHVPRLGNVQAMEILVKYQPQQAPTTTQTCDPKTPITWRAVFTIYDSDKHGNPTEQIAVDPDTGEQQIKDVAFQVQCAPPANVQGPGPQAPLENILPLIRELLNKLQFELSDVRMGLEFDLQEQDSILMDKRPAIADALQRAAQTSRNSAAALDLHFNRVQEPAFKDTLIKLPLLASLNAAATYFETSSTTVRGALPGDVQKVKDAMTAANAKLTELEGQTGAALSLFQSPPYNPKFKQGDILSFGGLTLRVTGMTTREGKPFYMFEFLDTATNTYKQYANYHAEQFDGFSGATKIGP